MRARTWASVLPLQSSSSLILASISREGDSPLVVVLFFILCAAPSTGFLPCRGGRPDERLVRFEGERRRGLQARQSSNAELLRVLAAQSLPTGELHDLG